MPSAYVYLPDDEPETQLVNGHLFKLRPNGTTEIRPYEPGVDWEALEVDSNGNPTGTAMTLWPDVSPDVVADHIVSKLSKWGVCRTSGPVVDGVCVVEADKTAVQAAERAYLIGTAEWCESVILSHERANAERKTYLLPAPETTEVLKARVWLNKNAAALKAARVI
jgi:hypothetical protein